MLSKLFNVLATLLILLTAPAAFSAAADPLFINLSTDDPQRISMAIHFGKQHSANGHPLTIFLNDKAVMLGVKSSPTKFADQQQALFEVISSGALIIMCPICLRQASYSEADLISGVRLGSPKITGDALFRDGTKTMSW